MTDTTTFSQAYATLQHSVSELRQLATEDIDQLVGVVETAARAHGQCKQRLAQVEALLAEHLMADTSEASTLRELFGDDP